MSNFLLGTGFLLLLLPPLASAQVEYGRFEFTGNDSSDANVSVTSQPPFGTFSPVIRVDFGDGGAPCSDDFSTYSGTASTLDLNKYAAITLTLSAPYVFAPATVTLKFTHGTTEVGGPSMGEARYRYGVDSFATAASWVCNAAYHEITGMIPAPHGQDTVLEVRFYIWGASNGLVVHAFDDILFQAVTAPSPALPVELTSFTATATAGGVQLIWSTATEVDNLGFDVERSTASGWAKIGFVEGYGTSGSPHHYEYFDAWLTGDASYRLRQIDRGGSIAYSPVVSVSGWLPSTLALRQNHPNPFNPSTQIQFALPQAGHVSIKVYNVLGREVATLVDGQRPAGTHAVTWNAENDPSGVYFCRMTAEGFTTTKRLALMK